MWLRHNCPLILTSSTIDFDVITERKMSEWKTGRCVKIVFVVTYGFIISCKKQNNVCARVTNCLCIHSSVILVFMSRVVQHKLFVTRVHTFLYSYPSITHVSFMMFRLACFYYDYVCSTDLSLAFNSPIHSKWIREIAYLCCVLICFRVHISRTCFIKTYMQLL